jgi:hypothetical protein
MKNTITILICSFLFFGCQQKIKPSDIANINGYWEIEKVVSNEEKDKKYSYNETFDYFEIKNNKGFRKKVMPQLDGSFLVNDAYENVEVTFKDEKVYLNYTTSFSKWSEELKAISTDEMIVVNSEKKEYHYKKTAPINLTGNGKTAQ